MHNDECLSHQRVTQLFDPVCLNKAHHYLMILFCLFAASMLDKGGFFFLSAHSESVYHVAFHMFFISFSLRFAFQCFFFSLSHKTDNNPSPPPENAGHDARGEEESLCCSLKDSSGSHSLLETIKLLH